MWPIVLTSVIRATNNLVLLGKGLRDPSFVTLTFSSADDPTWLAAGFHTSSFSSLET